MVVTDATPRVIQFFVPGVPVPGGSKKAFAHKTTGKIIVMDDAGKRNKDWRAVVALAARDAYQGEPLEGPLSVEMIFYMPRPNKHYRTGKNSGRLRRDAPTVHTGRPDALKLARSTEDALTSILWRDDSQTARITATKVYAGFAGAAIIVRPHTFDTSSYTYQRAMAIVLEMTGAQPHA